MKIKNDRLLAIITGVLFLSTGCVRQYTISRPAIYSAAQQRREAGLSPEETRRAQRNCPFGIPKADPQVTGRTDFIYRDGYVLQHSATDKIPLWVCEFMDTNQLSGKVTRDDKFLPDPLLKPGARAELNDYARSGYDRGHQAPAGDQTVDPRLKAETFYLSNMAPQIPAMNRQIWRELESLVRNWIIERGSGYIITGGMFYDPREDNPATARGTVEHKVIGKDAVAVPTHFYKIAVAKDAQGKWQAIAFVMENKVFTSPFHFEQFIVPIDWIEQHTGIDFMPELEPREEKRLERQPSPIWN